MKKILLICTLMALVSFYTQAQNCELKVEVGDHMNFAPTSLEISAAKCKSVTVNLTHTGSMPKSAMGHNWVLSKTAEAQDIAQTGWNAGASNQYLPPGDTRIIAGTDIIGGGESTSVTFDTKGLKPGGDYTFFCSFIGHYAIMKGKFTVTE